MRGADLSRSYYDDVVRPALDRRWPGLSHAAGRWGAGSDVLGLDDGMSRDHDWGLRLTILLDGGSPPSPAEVVDALERDLPETHAGLPTRFATTWDAAARHRVDVRTVESFLVDRTGVADPGSLDAAGWLALTGQAALEVVAGPVFADTTGRCTRARAVLAAYPADVRLHVLAAGWWRLAQELPLLGRAGQAGDEVGSAALGGRLAGVVLHLACVVEGVWAPYPKWLGAVVGRLPVGPALLPPLRDASLSDTWVGRQAALSRALVVLHEAQRSAGLPALDGDPVVPFFDRPFVVVDDALADALRAGVRDPAVRALPVGVGAVEQWCDSPAVLMDARRRRAVVAAAVRAV